MIIGSHVKMKAPEYVLGSVKEALSYDANALMLYTGAPQNTHRVDLSLMKIDEAKKLMSDNNIPFEHLIIHAPYIINLANSIKPEVSEIAKDFLKIELLRAKAIGSKYIVLHPGSYTITDLETDVYVLLKILMRLKMIFQKIS